MDNHSTVQDSCFFDWVIKTYSGKDNPRGDLAGDMKRDKEFPRVDDKEVILTHLWRRHACSEAIAAFESAWRQYKRKQKVK